MDCSTCLASVDANGDALYGCAWSAPDECEDCGACICDGSC